MDQTNNINTTKELTDAVESIKRVILQSQQRALGLINQEQLALQYWTIYINKYQ